MSRSPDPDSAGAHTPSKPRLAVVAARYGGTVVGGAETVLRCQAQGLAARGWPVDVLTTCVRDPYGVGNEFGAGVETEAGVTVRRFPAVAGDHELRHARDTAILRGEHLSTQQQEEWLNSGMRSPALYDWLMMHRDDYDVVLTGPYQAWTTYVAAQLAPEKTVLWACIHDEPHARLDIYREMFGHVAGLLLQTDPERDLAESIGVTSEFAVVGCGVEVPEHYDVDGFRGRHGVESPFLLYAGRREGAKRWEWLLESFAWVLARNDLPFSLVTMGAGPVEVPPTLSDRVVDLGFLDDTERDNAFAAAAAYVQPSVLEAFSRTIMEAWLAGTPVLANGRGDVVRWHCERSRAGLTFRDRFELEQCLGFLAACPDQAAELAAKGRAYVLGNYTWPEVLDRVELHLEKWLCESS